MDEWDMIIPGEENLFSSFDEFNLAKQALGTIKEPFRTAFILRYFEDWPIESNDPDQPTISKFFGKTSRTIRYWLQKAETALEKWRGENHE